MSLMFRRLLGAAAPALADYFAADGATNPIYAMATYPPAMHVPATGVDWYTYESFENGARVLIVTTHDHDTDTWTPLVPVFAHGLANDSHGVGALVRDADGYVHLFGGGHDSTIYEYVTENPDDPSSWWLRNTFTATVGYSYPHPVLVGSTLHLFLRERFGASTRRLVHFETSGVTGGVATWVNKKSIIDLGSDSRVYATVFIPFGTDIHFVWCLANDADTVRRDGFYGVYDTSTGALKNVDASFSVASGSLPLGRTDADANYRFLSQTTDQSNLPALCFDSSGDPHVAIMAGVGATGGAVDGVYDVLHYTHDGSAWSAPTTVIAGATIWRSEEMALVPLPAGEVALYYGADGPDTYDQGGTMTRIVRSAGGSWGSPSTVLAPTAFPLARVSAVRDAHADARVIFAEVAASDDDAETGAGTLKMYAHGDGGFLGRASITRADLVLNVAGAAAGVFEVGVNPAGTFITLKNLPYQPALVHLFGSGRQTVTNGTVFHARPCWGIAAMDGTQAAVAWVHVNGVDPSQERQWHSPAACYAVVDNDGSLAGTLGVDAMGADWIRFEVLSAFAASRLVSYLVVPGTAGTVAAFQEGDTTVATTGVDPAFAIVLGSNDTSAGPNVSTNSTVSVGFATAGDQFVVAGGALHNAATTVTRSYGRNGDVLALHNAGVTALDARAQIAFGTDQVTFSWSASASTRRCYVGVAEGGQYKVGKSLTSTVLNTDTGVSGFGFAPDAVMAMINRLTEAAAGSTVTVDFIVSQGVGTSTTSRNTQIWAVRNAATAAIAVLGHTTTELLRGVFANTAGTDSIVQLQAMGADGFTHRQTDPGGSAHWMPYVGVAE